MSLRPDSGGNASEGVESVIHTPSVFNPSSIAGEVAFDMTANLVDQLLEMSVKEKIDENEGARTDEVPALKAHIEQLQSELANAKSEVDFAQIEKAKLHRETELAQQTISGLQLQVTTIVKQVETTQKELTDSREEAKTRKAESTRYQEEAAQFEERFSSVSAELQRANMMLEQQAKEAPQSRELPTAADPAPSAKEEALGAQCDQLQGQVSQLQAQLNSARAELAEANQKLSQGGGFPAPTGDSEAQVALGAAYEQMAKLNTQISHLYADLTMARTELQSYRSGQEENSQEKSVVDVEKQNSQIADLVSDIRHLQLDLEYHQQKLDSLIDEKQQMMQELKRTHTELAAAKTALDERDQLLKHKDIDLARTREQSERSASPTNSAKLEEQLVAFRSEVAAKDSALIVSHYELHKEKLMRDRLEQKNLKLMERLQKLMMVVETQRKENFGLERKLASHERLVDDKDKQLQQVTSKAKQLARAFRANSKRAKGDKSDLSLSQGLPNIVSTSTLDNDPHRSLDGMGGSARTPRKAPSSR